MVAACYSCSRSAVVARTRAQVMSYLFFALAVVATKASSCFLNSTASVARRSSSVAMGGGGAAHQRCNRRREGGRPLWFERSRSKKKPLSSYYHARWPLLFQSNYKTQVICKGRGGLLRYSPTLYPINLILGEFMEVS
jgi:hypothetical protein